MPDTLPPKTKAAEPAIVHQATERPQRAKRHSWTRHWPLPVSLFLAIVYWLYLNEQVSRTVTPDLSAYVIEGNGRGRIHDRGLSIRTPSEAFMITEIRDSSDKVFDLQKRKIRFTIRAPGGYLKKVETSLPFIVDVQIRPDLDALDQGDLTWKFTRTDVKDANGELTPFIQAMEPAELTVYLKRKDSLDLELRPNHVEFQFPEEGGWNDRIFLDSMQFTPSFVTLSGPKAELTELGEETAIFLMDLRTKLTGLVSRRPNQRETVAAELKLREQFVKKGIRIAKVPRAEVNVAPEPALFKDLTVRVVPIWHGSNLNSDNYKIDQSVKVQIRSYNRELTRKLRVRKAAEAWVDKHVICFVHVASLDPASDPHKTDFQAYLEPWSRVFDEDYRLDQDIKIQEIQLIKIERKEP